MIVRKGVEPGNVSVDDFEMMSTASDKIVLPFIGGLWSELRLEAEQIILSAMESIMQEDYTAPHYGDIIHQTNTKFLFNIQRSGVRITAYIDVVHVNGTHASGRVFISTTPEEVSPILDHFFSLGCPGLSDDYIKFYRKVYSELLKK